jgi:Tol biopolymer transport system component
MSIRGLSTLGALLTATALLSACSDSTAPNSEPAATTPAAVPAPKAPPVEYVYIANANGSEATRLAPGGWPAWSPDAKQILVARDSNVVVVNVDGSGERIIAGGGSAAWSPDGKKIAFTSAEGISIMNADGTGVRLLVARGFRTDTYKPWDMGVAKPAWSPDGGRIAFEHLGDGDMTPATAFVVDTAGGAPSRVTVSSIFFAESDPSWSPDGSHIVYWSFGYGIATVNAPSGVPRVLYIDFPRVAYGARPVWSTKSDLIAFATFPFNGQLQSIYVIPAGGGSATLLIADGYQPAWSPDGAHIAFVSRRVQ